ncbi:MAG: hypothetical protein LWX83_14610 [Anaerolineae bacterium]|nr:hypothetical protein [Anaerolineae bacterium]
MILDILTAFWNNIAGQILFLTVAASLFSYLTLFGYLSIFMGGIGRMLIRATDFSITDILSLIPSIYVVFIELLLRLFVQFLQFYVIPYIVALVLVVNIPFSRYFNLLPADFGNVEVIA